MLIKRSGSVLLQLNCGRKLHVTSTYERRGLEFLLKPYRLNSVFQQGSSAFHILALLQWWSEPLNSF